jgi:glucosamine--fructose-6-phosphate aminotransferase (isomerizing)
MSSPRRREVSQTQREIFAQAETLPQTIEILLAREAPGPMRPPNVVPIFTGCGTSFHLALYAAALTRLLSRRPAAAVPASEAWLLPDLTLRPVADACLVGISRSGTTTEVLRALEAARGSGTPTLALTLGERTRMAATAENAIELPHVVEESVVMTQSFSNLLLALQWLVASLAGERDYLARLPEIASAVGPSLKELDRAARALLLRRPTHFVFLGSGPLLGVALEGMLKVKEMSQAPAEAYSSLEFRHGPMSTVTAGTLLVLISSPRTEQQDLRLGEQMAGLGATVVHLGPLPRQRLPPEIQQVELPAGFQDWMYASLGVPFLQLLALHQTAAIGLDPDAPRNLTSVVELEGSGR